MAEEIKQLVNQNFTGANMTNNNQFTLINNNSSTTAVVREVFVTGSDIAADKAKLFIDNNNIEVLSTFENAAGTMVIAPSQNMTMKLNTDITPGTKSVVTTDIHDFNNRSSGNTSDHYDNITEVVSFSGTDSNFSLKSSAGTEGITKSDTVLLNGNHTGAFNQQFGSSQFMTACKLADGNTISFRKDDNSTFQAHYNNSQVVNRSYGAPAMDFVNRRIFYFQSNTIRMFDPSLSTSATYTVAQQAYSTASTYANGAVCYDDDGDLYYFYRYNNTLYVRNLVDSGDLSGNNSGSGYSANLFKQINLYTQTNVSHQKLMVAYNDSEDKFYVFHGGQHWYNFSDGLLTFTKSAYNSASNTGQITHTEIKHPRNSANLDNVVAALFTAEHKAAIAASSTVQNEKIWGREHLGGGYVAFPTGDTEAYIYLCENNSLTFKFKLTGLRTKGGSQNNNRAILPKGGASRTGDISFNDTNLTPANYDIAARVNIQGVEIT